jgi:hypothetical protein
VGIVGADVMALVAAQLLEADPDVGLDVLDQMADMDRAVGVGQGAGDEDAAGRVAHGGTIAVGRKGRYVSSISALLSSGGGGVNPERRWPNGAV